MFSYSGVEYIIPSLFKAYLKSHAEDFINGIVYFTNLEDFRKNEDPQRGDAHEGTGTSIINGTKYNAGFQGVFVWCSTMETQKDEILKTWHDRDTVIEVFDRLKFIDRIIAAGKNHKSLSASFHIGPVTYDKDSSSHRPGHIVDGIFQKNLNYRNQKEFRMAIYGDRMNLPVDEQIILKLGDCSDIARIM